MARQLEPGQYVKWEDVITWMRWLELGYGGRVRVLCVQACPKGEQFPRLYWELQFCDADMAPRELGGRVLGQFPTASSKSVPALLLGMLMKLDNLASQSLVWTEPPFGQRPRGGV